MRTSKRERRQPSRHPPQHRPDEIASTDDERVAHLHQTVGNSGVQRLVRDGDVPTGGSPEEQAALLEHAIAERLPTRPLTDAGELQPAAVMAVEGLAGPVAGTTVETDGAAIAARREAGAADAMTVDGHVTLSPTVDPESTHGRAVLAHELVHAGQQRSGQAAARTSTAASTPCGTLTCSPIQAWRRPSATARRCSTASGATLSPCSKGA